MNHTPCSIDGCDRHGTKRGMCGSHYNRWYRKAMREGTFIRLQRRSDHIPADEGIAEFEMISGHTDTLTACRRVGVHPRTVVRWYKRMGKPVPAGLYGAETIVSRGTAA